MVHTLPSSFLFPIIWTLWINQLYLWIKKRNKILQVAGKGPIKKPVPFIWRRGINLVIFSIFFQESDSNPGRLAEKHESYLCAGIVLQFSQKFHPLANPGLEIVTWLSTFQSHWCAATTKNTLIFERATLSKGTQSTVLGRRDGHLQYTSMNLLREHIQSFGLGNIREWEEVPLTFKVNIAPKRDASSSAWHGYLGS